MKLFNEDNLKTLKTLQDNSIDSVITDGPYGISFMNKKWDYDVPSIQFWQEVYRVLKPGGHVLSFGGTRTYHRMVVNIEDAGFEIRDQIMWIYGTGFPKSTDIGKKVVELSGLTDYNGWGTALKPANEPICVARKPLSEKNNALNTVKWGTGGINIDACKIGDDVIKTQGYGDKGFVANANFEPTEHVGRFPANILFDECAAGVLDKQFGKTNALLSKFFYVAKTSKKEKNLGLDLLNMLSENDHPTVKPVTLMSYLCKLVTPSGGIILDPFMGSGSTGIAAQLEGFDFIGIELEQDYFEIAKARISGYQKYSNYIAPPMLEASAAA